MPIEDSENGLPFGPITVAPAFTQRLAKGTSAVTTMAPGPARSAIQSSAASIASFTTTRSIHGSLGTFRKLLATTVTCSP